MDAELIARLFEIANEHQATADAVRSGSEAQSLNAELGDLLGFARFSALSRKAGSLSQQLAALSEALAAEAAAIADEAAAKRK